MGKVTGQVLNSKWVEMMVGDYKSEVAIYLIPEVMCFQQKLSKTFYFARAGR